MWRTGVLLLALLGGIRVEAGRCECGVFVPTMMPMLSTIPPLEYLGSGFNMALNCDINQCRTLCAQQGAITDWNLNQGFPAKGTQFCTKAWLQNPKPITNEPLEVFARVPDCETFIVWGTSSCYSPGVTLCCIDGSYISGSC